VSKIYFARLAMRSTHIKQGALLLSILYLARESPYVTLQWIRACATRCRTK